MKAPPPHAVDSHIPVSHGNMLRLLQGATVYREDEPSREGCISRNEMRELFAIGAARKRKRDMHNLGFCEKDCDYTHDEAWLAEHKCCKAWELGVHNKGEHK